MIGDTVRLLRSAGVRAVGTLPVVGRRLAPPRRLEIDGSVVFITGAARGLGAEIARQAHARGARVALVGRRLAPLQELADELGDRTAAFQADVTDAEALQRAADGAAETFGRIDVVVANAGIAPPSRTVATMTPDDFEKTVEVDLLGQWRTARATLPRVIERRGHLMFVGSIYAFFNGVLAAPMPVESAAAAVLSGIERRAPRVTAPTWVAPLLAVRSLTTAVMDQVLLTNPAVGRAIGAAEADATSDSPAP